MSSTIQYQTTGTAADLARRIGDLTGAEVQALSHEVYQIVSIAAHLATVVQQAAGVLDDEGRPVPASVDAGSSGVPTLPLDGVPTPE